MLRADLTKKYENSPKLRKYVRAICKLYKKVASTVPTTLDKFIAKKKKTL